MQSSDPIVLGDASSEVAPAPVPARRDWRGIAWRGLGWALVALILGAGFVEGVRLRRWVWEMTAGIHFESDIRRGCYWGLVASGPEGYLNQYDKMALEKPRWGVFLDYDPLRLLVMSRWGAWIRRHDPPDPGASLMDAWRSDYAYNAPVLHVNEAMDLLAAGAAFALTWLWARRGSRSPPTHFRGVWQGTTAALLVWFNPAMLLSAYGWPTWDAWIVPGYLLTALLASLDWWFCAGLVFAVAAMFKGQQLAIFPVFIVWALMLGKPGAALRWCAGVVLGLGMIGAPWALSYIDPQKLAELREYQAHVPVLDYPQELFAVRRIVDGAALAWIGGTLAAAALLPWLARRLGAGLRQGWTAQRAQQARALLILAAVAVGCAAVWPWLLPRNRAQGLLGLCGATLLAAAATGLRPRKQGYVLAGALGAMLLLSASVFHGSAAWWECGVNFGMVHFRGLVQGLTCNLPGLMRDRFGWHVDWDQTAVTLPAIPIHWPAWAARWQLWPAAAVDLTCKQLFDSIYGVMLLLACIGVGLQARRRSRRVLVALVTPWLMFFCFPVQIHERYLLFAAGVAAICIGQSVGMALLGIFLSVLAWMQTIAVMLDHGDVDRLGQAMSDQFPWLFSPSAGQTLKNYIDNSHPDMAWAVLLAGMIFLWISLTRDKTGGA